MSNHPAVNTAKGIKNKYNFDICDDPRRVNNKKVHSLDARRSVGIFFDVDDNDEDEDYNLVGIRGDPDGRNNMSFWLEGKELGSPILDALPMEGNSFCISGRHYKNSPNLLNHIYFANMKPLAEFEFDIGTHVYPKDYSKVNSFLPEETNKAGFDGKEQYYTTAYSRVIGNKDAKEKMMWLPEPDLTAFPDAFKFYIQWKTATQTFFHIKRSRLVYTKGHTYNKRIMDDAEKLEVRALDDPKYVDFTFKKGDKNLGYLYRPAIPENQPDRKCKNPYFIDVTEIEVDGVKLHNWLHITVYVRRENIIKGRKNCATGKMKWILLEVRDSLGLPIGDFSSTFPCGASCRCKSSNCKMVKGMRHHAMPCMFTPTRALTVSSTDDRRNIYSYEICIVGYF